MRPAFPRPLLALGLLSLVAATAPAQAPKPAAIPIDDFESDLKGWKFVGGEEFPGAKGALERDATAARAGKESLRLDGDFRGGGAYVGSWKDLDGLDLPDVDQFRVWVRVRDLNGLGVRLVDATGQCHQGRATIPDGAEGGWRELVLNVADLVGGEHWGGANDGKWHGPAKGLGLNVGKDVVKGEGGRSSLWLDDLTAVPVAAGTPTLVSCTIEPTACRPGFGSRMTYAWDAEPLGIDCSVFVHFRNEKGQMVFQADHDPGAPTSRWSGRVEYAKTIVVPSETPPGRYEVVLGFWSGKPVAKGGGRKTFRAGAGSNLAMVEPDACRVGYLDVRADAPLPTLPPPSLNLSGWKRTFGEEFDGPLSVSAWGPGTRWIAHTPYGGDFGDAGFADPQPDFPFTVKDDLLRIEAKKVEGRWRSGLLSSVDAKGEGFSQKFGYFEMRAKFPKGPGTWPAFWLLGVPQLQEPKDKKTLTQIELDVVEQYGVNDNALHTTTHLWPPVAPHTGDGDVALVPDMTADFHTYGVMVDDAVITYYFDGVPLRTHPTPPEAKVPLYLLVDLALGGGWPVDKTPDPSIMIVDYVRVYAKE
ncbi:glycoside hydrolase family 16 protein [Paludisphaera mucosa]|uniref:Glycoside hydrolase family 16 protein n=1 Tax=Paludisphaera mucosa TaxID=3030827 RepID=A0ABT6FBX4_9BACT|nr:glycoside hydrolase family 16 protein [Paludisphaera mucosa]MDG3005067.1 glycoside hydrolase family 16 protein [Paludisphaera mucosa]